MDKFKEKIARFWKEQKTESEIINYISNLNNKIPEIPEQYKKIILIISSVIASLIILLILIQVIFTPIHKAHNKENQLVKTFNNLNAIALYQSKNILYLNIDDLTNKISEILKKYNLKYDLNQKEKNIQSYSLNFDNNSNMNSILKAISELAQAGFEIKELNLDVNTRVYNTLISY